MASAKTQQHGENEDGNWRGVRHDDESWDSPVAITRAIRIELRKMSNFQLLEIEQWTLHVVHLDSLTVNARADSGDLELLKECQEEMGRRTMKTH